MFIFFPSTAKIKSLDIAWAFFPPFKIAKSIFSKQSSISLFSNDSFIRPIATACFDDIGIEVKNKYRAFLEPTDLTKYGLITAGISPNLTSDKQNFAFSPPIAISQAANVLATVRQGVNKRRGLKWTKKQEKNFKKKILDQYEFEGNPFYASARIWDDGIIDPADTRRVLGLSIGAALNVPIEDTKFGLFRL